MIDKKLFEKVKKIALEHREQAKLLNDEIQAKYGFGYSDYDEFEEIIDALDYGYGYCDYERMILLLERQHQKGR